MSESEDSKLETSNSKLSMKRSPLLVIFVTVFIDLVGFGIVIPVLPYYAEASRFGATPRAVGLLFASYSVMQLIFSPVLGRLSDKYGRRPILLISLLGTCLGFLILGFATTLLMLFVGRIIDGISGASGRGWKQVIEALRQPQLTLVLTIYFLSIVAFSIMTAVFSLFMMFRLGYDPWHSGWIFAFVGIISAVVQGGLIGKLVKRFGEPALVIVGGFLFTVS